MTERFTHWRDVPTDSRSWRWPSFEPREIACRGSGELLIHDGALNALQSLRYRLGKPMVIRSAYRSAAHNARVGGVRTSKHLTGTAFDIAMADHDPRAFETAARASGFQGFGFYPAKGFMHIDLGPPREWGQRWGAEA